MTDRVEAAAHVLHDLDNDGNGLTWDQADRLYQDEYRRRARAVLTAADTADTFRAELVEWQHQVADALGMSDGPGEGIPWHCANAEDVAETVRRLTAIATEVEEYADFNARYAYQEVPRADVAWKLRQIIERHIEPLAAGAAVPGDGDSDG